MVKKYAICFACLELNFANKRLYVVFKEVFSKGV